MLYSPSMWSEKVNGYLYQYVALALQISQAHNITIAGCREYNVPSEDITLENPPEAELQPSAMSYSQYAISGADDFNDEMVTVKEVFDVVVKTTRKITPTCESSGV